MPAKRVKHLLVSIAVSRFPEKVGVTTEIADIYDLYRSSWTLAVLHVRAFKNSLLLGIPDNASSFSIGIGRSLVRVLGWLFELFQALVVCRRIELSERPASG